MLGLFSAVSGKASREGFFLFFRVLRFLFDPEIAGVGEVKLGAEERLLEEREEGSGSCKSGRSVVESSALVGGTLRC